MNQGVNEFQQKLGPGVVGLFFYAGHGMQVDGENYLLPTDATLPKKDAIKNETISVSSVLKIMQKANTKMNIIIFDACRNDPFKRGWGEEQNRNFSLGGLAPVDAKVGSLIAYSTAPGDYAADGYGRNSPYTEQLKQQIKTPNLDIYIMFRNVRAGVYQETKGNQIPWVSVSITNSFAFNSTQSNNNNKPIINTSEPTNNLPVIVAARAISPSNMYERLEYFLSNKQWQKADQQTWEIMRQVSSFGRKISLDSNEINNFSCQDLTKIDQLWLKHSNNRFGLSIQEGIYQTLGGNKDKKSLLKFLRQIGWRRLNNNQEEYLSYNELTFSENAPLGHFPTTAGIDGLSSVARNWALYTTEYESFLTHLLDRVAVCK